MTTGGTPRTATRHALWLGGLLVLLAGLIGMHGLDSHGANGVGSHGAMGGDAMASAAPIEPGMASPTVSGVAMMHGASYVAPAVQRAVMSGHRVMGTATGVASGVGMDMGMAAMCLAILAAAWAALLRRLSAARLQPLLWAFARPARARAHEGRDPDPPSLISLSIQRC